MAVEIEVKLRVDDLAPVRDRLRKLGAQPLGEVLETNHFLDTADRALLTADCGLRIRRNRNLASGTEKIVITYKGPREEGPVKKREEIELAVNDLHAAKVLLERLGYQEQLCFEKRRESWLLGNCKVELDEMPKMGTFVEIEAPSDGEVTELQKRLGLEKLQPVQESYADLVTRRLSDLGAHGTTLTFTS